MSLLLITSAPLGQATEASSLPSISVVAASVPAEGRAEWEARLDRSTPSSTDGLPHLTGGALLAELGALEPGKLDRVLEKDPRIVSRILAHPPTAAQAAATWRLMSDEQQDALLHASPRLVGALEGVPYATRDIANRAELTRQIGSIERRLDAGSGRAVTADLRTRLHMLEQIREALRAGGGLHRQLVAFDDSGQGRAVIGIGDVDRADYVGFLVPGMYYGVDARIVPWTQTAASIQSQQRKWLDREGSPRTSAVLAWIGYETPTLVDVASMTDARTGSGALAASLEGLRQARTGAEPYLSLLAHSYGATAAMLAVEDGHATVDALAVVGSPGSPAPTASALGVENGNVWVGAAPWDPIAQSGVFGSQPTSPSYGARSMGVAGSVDPATGTLLTGTLSHNDYFAPGSETLRNFAVIGIGADDSVLRPDGRTVSAAGG